MFATRFERSLVELSWMMDRISIDMKSAQVTVEDGGKTETHPLASAEGFEAVSRAWMRASWDAKYMYSLTWMGRPIIQLPEDMVRVQELVYEVKPDVILETGVAHGGSLIFYSSLCKAMDKGRVIGVDIEIRPHNRQAIEKHPLVDRITLVEGNSIDPTNVTKVKSLIKPNEQVLLILDSCHDKSHVLGELAAYAPLVKPGSYVVVMDGIMEWMVGAPRSKPDWDRNNPKQAAAEFVRSHPEFAIVDPPFPFNEGVVKSRITHAIGGILKRIS
jgi:cephalosporin hydroxylase